MENKAMIKPQTDKLEYQALQLDNGLHALLISDPTTDKASAAMDVNVGSLSDPVQLPGLAHFLEHMLFYSNSKYPEEDAYSRFISEHGGMTNAFTAAEDTNYYFDVNHDHLEPALDRFAQFFICPLISEDGVDREANAVDSEHGKNVNTDAWRFSQLWKSLSNQRHPFSHFSTGNLDTLIRGPKAEGVSVHEAVQKFAAERYSANIMQLVVYGRESLCELEQLVQSKFATVVNRGLTVSHFPGNAVLPEHCQCLVKVVPQKETDSLDLQWPIPPEQSLFRSRPCSYLSYLLGHEGEGSVFAVLKAMGWATGLSAGEGGLSFSGRSFFSVHIVLTKEGNAHAQEVLGLVFAYIEMLRQPGGVTKERFEEIQALARMGFDFSDKINPGRLTSMLAQTLQHVPPQLSLLSLHNVPLDFDADAINAALAELTAANVRIMWASRQFQGKTSQTETWYGTEYSTEPLAHDWIAGWELPGNAAGLHLPTANPFIPTDFSMVEAADTKQAAEPQVVHDSPLVRLWHKLEAGFGAPKAVVYLAFHSPGAYSSPEAAVCTRLFVRLTEDALNEVAYEAELAGLSYHLQNTTSGFLASFSGYNHKLMELVHQVLAKVAAFTVDPDRFQVQREAVSREYANMRYEQPYQTAIYTSSLLHELRKWHVSEYQAVIGDLTPDHVASFVRALLRRCWVQGFATGNLRSSEAGQLAEYLEKLLKEDLGSLPLFPSQQTELRVVKIPAGKPALLCMPVPNPVNENSAIIISYQVGPDEPKRNVTAELWVKCTKQAAFHELRTQQQLGYIVFLSTWANLTVRSVAFILQSTAYAAAILEQRCEAFLRDAAQLLADMSDADFTDQVEELAKAKLEKPKRLKEQAAKEWREIDDGTRVFRRPEVEVASLRQLTKPDLAAFFAENVLDPHKRRKVSVHVEGAKTEQAADGIADGPDAAADRHAENQNGAEASTAPETASAVNGAAEQVGSANGRAEGGDSLANGDGDSKVAGSEAEEGDSLANGKNLANGKKDTEPDVELLSAEDIWSFKRGLEVFASPK